MIREMRFWGIWGLFYNYLIENGVVSNMVNCVRYADLNKEVWGNFLRQINVDRTFIAGQSTPKKVWVLSD